MQLRYAYPPPVFNTMGLQDNVPTTNNIPYIPPLFYTGINAPIACLCQLISHQATSNLKHSSHLHRQPAPAPILVVPESSLLPHRQVQRLNTAEAGPEFTTLCMEPMSLKGDFCSCTGPYPACESLEVVLIQQCPNSSYIG